jgi:hypothetical protein
LTSRVRRNSEVAEVCHGEACRRGELGDAAVREDEDVLEDPVGKSRLAIAVVPGQLGQLQQVEGGVGVARERSLDDRPELLATLAAAGHQPRSRHSGRLGRSAPRVESLPWPG